MGNIPPLIPRKTNSNIWRHAQAGLVLSVTILLCIYVGLMVDKRWSISPWGVLVGAVVGFGAGLYNFLKEFLNNDETPGQKS